MGDDLKIFCSDVDALGAKFLVDQWWLQPFSGPLVAFAT